MEEATRLIVLGRKRKLKGSGALMVPTRAGLSYYILPHPTLRSIGSDCALTQELWGD